MIYKLFFKSRGKSFRSTDGNVFKGPKILYFDEAGIESIKGILRYQTYNENDDFEISILSDEEILNMPNIPVVANYLEGRSLDLDLKMN